MKAQLARYWSRVRTVPPLVILVIGWVAFLGYAYPGLMTRDSFDQLRQARSGVFLDDHPPLMQAIVSVLDHIIAAPFSVILLQSGMLLAGLYLLLRRRLTERAAAATSVAFLWFPPVLSVMTTMWKDPMMAGALMLATALIIAPRRGVRIAGLLLALVATGVRFNALAATFAIVVLLFEWLPPHEHRWRNALQRYGISVAAWLAITAGALGINAALTDRETHLWYTTLVGDITGTLAFVDDERSDTSLRRALAGTQLRVNQDIHASLRAAYRSESMLNVVLGDGRVFDLPLADVEPPGKELRDALYRAWKTIVFRNVLAYLRYRVDRFRVVLGLTTDDETAWDVPIIVTHEYQDKAALQEHGIATAISPVQSAIDAVVSWFSHTPLFRPFVYLIVSLALLVMARRNRLAAALLLSGLGIELSLFFLAHSMDYRYSHWMICTTLLAAILLFLARIRGD